MWWSGCEGVWIWRSRYSMPAIGWLRAADLGAMTGSSRPIAELRKSIQTLHEAGFQNSKSVVLEAANLYEAKCTFRERK
jgi:hypothetical protein